ncbi:MAG TPA: hypothetical protein VFX20_17315 [Steroidobacteraceae bacterium]|nr:hypothetical protein [Steroidobacteraceae bacterium]
MRVKRIRPVRLLLATAAMIAGRASPAGAAAPSVNQQHAFDFHFGTWRTHILTRNSSAAKWVKMTGTVIDRPLREERSPAAWSDLQSTHTVYRVWDDWADIGQLEVDGPHGHVEDLALRLYDRGTHQWRVYFANSKSGRLGQPTVGGFADGAGIFIGLEDVDGKTVLMRNVWSGITTKTCRQEWSISADGGKTWTPTWISNDTRSD